MTCLGGSSIYTAAATDGYALVTVAAACFRSAPSHTSELETQATYGTPLRLLGREGEWLRASTPEGYEAYVNESALAVTDSAGLELWKRSPRLIVTALRPITAYADSVNLTFRNVAFDLTLGAIVQGEKKEGARFASVTLPDGRRGFVASSALDDFATWSLRHASPDAIMDAAYSMCGVTYLWGGTTPKAIDCSGFTKVCYFAAGLILPRNASQQARCGTELPVDADGLAALRKADLLFFGDGDGERITHVGLYDSRTQFIHASGRVFVASFDERNPLY